MARIRTIKPEFWEDEDLSAISCEAVLLAIGLLNQADDEGYFRANPKLLEAKIFPLRELDGSVTVHVQTLEKIDYLRLFTGSDGKEYGVVTNFVKHQVINKAKPSVIKDLEELPYQDGSDPTPIPVGKEGKGRERKGKEGSSYVGQNPTMDAKSCIEYLNQVTNSKYKPVEANIRLLRARFDEGHSVDDVCRVIDFKNGEWSGTKAEQYLRPATLFNAQKFNQYIGQVDKPSGQKSAILDFVNMGEVVSEQ